MIGDPAGYFVVYVDHHRGILSLEHYDNDGVLDVVIEADQAAGLYIPAIERGLISRLDHAAYLGRELARAEEALRTGAPYIQDAAPEMGVLPSQSATPCGTSCRENGT
jgi:tetrahydromethanopterin S-methyltransferase subunit A